ncbi:hypothetical protein MKD35_234 [Aureococcus anophagefferens virus]|nr:hypothetical protein MKD35_234 [Aureococcus anophagefferens virus]
MCLARDRISSFMFFLRFSALSTAKAFRSKMAILSYGWKNEGFLLQNTKKCLK